MIDARYPRFRRRRTMRRGDLSLALLAVAFAIPFSVGILGIPKVYALGGASLPSFTVSRPLVGAQAVGSRASAVPDLPPTLAPNPNVPPIATAAPVETARHTYTVQRGDELRHIAAEHGVTIRSLLAINDIPNPDSLRVGQVLQLPDAP